MIVREKVNLGSFKISSSKSKVIPQKTLKRKESNRQNLIVTKKEKNPQRNFIRIKFEVFMMEGD